MQPKRRQRVRLGWIRSEAERHSDGCRRGSACSLPLMFLQQWLSQPTGPQYRRMISSCITSPYGDSGLCRLVPSLLGGGTMAASRRSSRGGVLAPHSRTVVLRPTCRSKPAVGAQLMRITASAASIRFP
eukprot:1661674-Prymnesium_polylepis.1